MTIESAPCIASHAEPTHVGIIPVFTDHHRRGRHHRRAPQPRIAPLIAALPPTDADIHVVNIGEQSAILDPWRVSDDEGRGAPAWLPVTRTEHESRFTPRSAG